MKYFCISDIHSYYESMIKALNAAGYDKNNKDHILVVLGDIFDRGPDSIKVYSYIQSIPRERRILIRGNHELLLKEACERKQFLSHDVSNGTINTVAQFIRADLRLGYFNNYIFVKQERELTNDEIFRSFNTWNIIDWIMSDEWVNYYEIKDYILVHCWLPVKKFDDESMYNPFDRKFKYRKDWREATQEEWNDAMWGCPWYMYKMKLYPKDKTIICGHWHVSDFYKNIDGKQDKCYNTYINKNIVGLDACTALTNKCNVFVIDN